MNENLDPSNSYTYENGQTFGWVRLLQFFYVFRKRYVVEYFFLLGACVYRAEAAAMSLSIMRMTIVGKSRVTNLSQAYKRTRNAWFANSFSFLNMWYVLSKVPSREEQISLLVFMAFLCVDGQTLHNDFMCAIQGTILIHGRLYICSSCICFYSNWLGSEIKKALPYSRITKLRKHKVAFLNPAVDVSITYKGTSKTYTFTSFFPGSRDSCFKLCEQLYKKSIQAEGGRVFNNSQDGKSEFSSQPGHKSTQAETNARSRRANTDIPHSPSKTRDTEGANLESVEPALITSPVVKEEDTPGVVDSNDSQEGT